MAWDYTPAQQDAQAAADPVWMLERMINYGLEGKKLSKKLLEQYLPELKIDDNRRAFLELLVWNKPF